MALTRNALVTVTVDDEPLGPKWITKSGGQTEADGQKIRLGGMSDEIAFGGPASTENVTVARVFDAFMQTKYKGLRSKVGRASMSVTYTPLGNDKAPSGPSETYTGILQRVTLPEADDNAADIAMIELELSANEAVG